MNVLHIHYVDLGSDANPILSWHWFKQCQLVFCNLFKWSVFNASESWKSTSHGAKIILILLPWRNEKLKRWTTMAKWPEERDNNTVPASFSRCIVTANSNCSLGPSATASKHNGCFTQNCFCSTTLSSTVLGCSVASKESKSFLLIMSQMPFETSSSVFVALSKIMAYFVGHK